MGTCSRSVLDIYSHLLCLPRNGFQERLLPKLSFPSLKVIAMSAAFALLIGNIFFFLGELVNFILLRIWLLHRLLESSTDSLHTTRENHYQIVVMHIRVVQMW